MRQIEISYHTLTSAGAKLDLDGAVAKAADASAKAEGKVNLEISLLLNDAVTVIIDDDNQATCIFRYDGVSHTVPVIASRDVLDSLIASYEAAVLSMPKRAHGTEGGLYIILGGAESGKTKWLTQHVESIWFAGEPDHRAIGYKEAITRIRKLALAKLSKHTILGVDSFKDAVYTSDGAAMSGGVSSGFLYELGELSRMLAGSNLSVIAIVNPVQEKLLEPLYESIAGSVSGVIWLDKGKVKKGTERVWNQEGNYYERRSINQTPLFHFQGESRGSSPTLTTRSPQQPDSTTYINRSTVNEVAQLIAKQTGVL